jgi:hypothetical protein
MGEETGEEEEGRESEEGSTKVVFLILDMTRRMTRAT